MEVTQEEQNFFACSKIVLDVIPESLRIVFKREWDALYANEHGEWKDTPEYGPFFLSKEKRIPPFLDVWKGGNRMNKDLLSLIQALINSESLRGMKDQHVLDYSVQVLRDLRNYHFGHVSSSRVTAFEFHVLTEICLIVFEVLKVDTTALLEAISLAIPTFTDKESTLRWINLEWEVILSKIKRINVTEDLTSLPLPKTASILRVRECFSISRELGLDMPAIATSVVILRGMPGCGKTTVASQYSHYFIRDESQSRPKCVLWINASTLDTLLDSLSGCGKAIGIPKFILLTILLSEYLSHEDKATTLMGMTFDILDKYESWLIVVDDVQDVQSFVLCLPKEGGTVCGHGSVIIATNNGSQATISNTGNIVLGGMSEYEVIQLLSQSGDVNDESYHSALTLAKMLDLHHLALAIVAYYITSTREFHGQEAIFEDFLKKLRECKEQSIQKQSRMKDLKHIVYVAIDMAINQEITKQEMLLPFQYIQAYIELTSKKDGIQKRDLIKFIKNRMPEVDENALISYLESSSLVSANDDNSQFSVHPIVLSVLQDVVSPDTSGKFVFRRRIMIIGQDRAGKTCLRKSLCGLTFKPDEPSTDGVDAALYELDVVHVNASDFRRKDEELLSPDALSLMIAKDLKLPEKPEIVEQAVSSPEGIRKDSSDSAEMIHTDEVNKPDQHAQQPQQDDRVASENEATIDEQTDESIYSSAGEAEIPDDVVESIIKFLQNEQIEESITNKEITLSIWDFAGQHLYYASHQVFLSPRATYILVYNLAKDLNAQAEPCVRQGTVDYLLDNPNNEANLDSILSWLNSVHTVCQTEENDEETRPPVIIVGTHADEPFEDIKEMEKKLKIGIVGKSYQKHVIKPCFTVNSRGEFCLRMAQVTRACVIHNNGRQYLPDLQRYINVGFGLCSQKLEQERFLIFL